MQYIHTFEETGVFIYANDKKKDNANSTNLKRTSFNSDKDIIQKNILETVQKKVFSNPDTPPRQVFTNQISELNQIFTPMNLYSKLVQLSEKELIFESINGQKIHFEDLSSGEKMLYYMGFMLNQLNLKNTLILIDQPEDALHPTWQQQITAFFKNIGKNNQVILATHSPQIIASVHPESVFVLGIEGEKRKIKAFNMATEHKNSYGVDANRILSEIMGTPIRSFEAQQRIRSVNNLIKEIELNPAPSSLVILENQIDTLAIDFGKQDAAVMRLRNELRLLKRNVELRK
jgi:predicted ATP-binding protein involved in virulence